MPDTKFRKLGPYEGAVTLLTCHGVLCWYCGELAATTRDHIIPKSKAKGLHNNKVPACRPCNQEKGNKTPEEFREYLKAWERRHPKTTKHSVVAIRARGWRFYGEKE